MVLSDTEIDSIDEVEEFLSHRRREQIFRSYGMNYCVFGNVDSFQIGSLAFDITSIND